MDDIVENLIHPKYSEPLYFLNFFKIDRNFVAQSDPSVTIRKKHSLCWKIENENLEKVDVTRDNIFFDTESYIVQTFLDLKFDKTVKEEWLLHYWRGQHATKGITPLPPSVSEDYPMERICQWSEPAIFFRGISKTLIVFSGERKKLDTTNCHLFMVRGELLEEIHLYEISCEKRSLRSKTSFLLISPVKKVIIYWHGNQTTETFRRNVVSVLKPQELLKNYVKNWSGYSLLETFEGSENDLFTSALKGNITDYYTVKTISNPRLFYLNSLLDRFGAIEIEYPLRTLNEIVAFPFLQTHLYSADQPAFFLLDNGDQLWLWQGPKTESTDLNVFEQEFNNSEQLLRKYARKKEELNKHTVTVKHVYAYQEPLEFKNMFPIWTEK